MKKHLTKALAILLVIAALLSQTAFAATYYYVEVALTGPTSVWDETAKTYKPSTEQTETGTSGHVSRSSSVANAIFEAYGDMQSRVADTFKNCDLSGIVAYCETAYKDDEWDTMERQYDTAVTCDPMFKDANTTLNALTLDHPYTLKFDYDEGKNNGVFAGKDVKYIVTVTLRSGSTGSTVTPQEPTVEVKPVTDNSGTTTISKPAAKPGEKVSVTTKPAENKITGYVDVRDQNGNKVPLKYDGNGNYTFEMPEGGVTVETTYRPAPTDPKVSGVDTLLNTDDHIAFMQGYPDGDFKPNGSISRAEVATIFYRLLRDQNVETEKSFNDIDGHWAATAVEVLSSLGIIKGMTEDSFAPQASITRAQFAAICARFATAVTNRDVTFTDVSANHWASAEIGTAAAYGWIYGKGDGNFDPDGAITRTEAAAIINRMLARLGDQVAIDAGNKNAFTDLSDTHWGWYEIHEATYGHDHTDEAAFVHEFWTE